MWNLKKRKKFELRSRVGQWLQGLVCGKWEDVGKEYKVAIVNRHGDYS